MVVPGEIKAFWARAGSDGKRYRPGGHDYQDAC
jgi:hypothetical protein